MKGKTKDEYGKSIGEQISEAQIIYCPVCLDKEFGGVKLKQPLYTVVDYECELFCPDCDFVAMILVENI